MGIRDSRALAGQAWMGSSQFDPKDHWPRRWLHSLGLRGFPVVGWAQRGGGLALYAVGGVAGFGGGMHGYNAL